MHHVAIMKKSFRFLQMIVDGSKTIESRWYKTKRSPWNKISAGDIIYFKNTGESVTVRATADKVLQFCDLNEEQIKELVAEFGLRIGLCAEDFDLFVDSVSAKKYCILVFLKNVECVSSFNVDKSGFGLMSAWLCVDNINKIKK